MITTEHVRAAGGIVHSDGNIFFTNLEKLNAAVTLAQQAEAHPVGYLIRKADQPNTKGWLIPADQVGSYQRDTLTREPVYTIKGAKP